MSEGSRVFSHGKRATARNSETREQRRRRVVRMVRTERLHDRMIRAVLREAVR